MGLFKDIKNIKETIEILTDQNAILDKKIKAPMESNDRLRRIVKNSINGVITYENVDNYWFVSQHSDRYFCRIYKDRDEYEIKGLILENPTFKEGKIKGIITVEDWSGDGEEKRYGSYVIDLGNCTFLRVS